MFPLWMGLCALGLASADPVLPLWLEMAAIALLGAGPIVAMQVLRPFNIFSALMVAIPTDCLDDDRRRILALLKEC
ncbi:MAG: low-complexity tail membrane protein, partial [Cyanobacteria bacterium P01_G01_bin.4]